MSLTLLERARAKTVDATETADPNNPLAVQLRVNGRDHRVPLDTRTSLLDSIAVPTGNGEAWFTLTGEERSVSCASRTM